jgi:Glycosyltransferase
MGIGGIQTMLTGIANIQVEEGHEVGIFVIDTYVSEAIMSKLDHRVKVFFMGRIRGTKPVWPFVKLNWHLWKYKPDIIHSHAGKLIRVVLSKTPIIATIHGQGCNLKDYKRYDTVCAISKSIQQEWTDKWNITPSLIENGIDCEKMKTIANIQNSNELHFVQVSRVIFDPKGQDILVKAFSMLLQRILKENCGKKCFLHFVGDGLDIDKLKKLVDAYQINDYVKLEGFKDPKWIQEHLCEYDLFVQPSRREGFGLTVAEACAAKIPVLVSDIEGPLEIIDYGELGMIFRCGDVEDLADKLYQFVKKGRDNKQVKAAYNHTINHYDIHVTTAKYMDIYNRVLGNQ